MFYSVASRKFSGETVALEGMGLNRRQAVSLAKMVASAAPDCGFTELFVDVVDARQQVVETYLGGLDKHNAPFVQRV